MNKTEKVQENPNILSSIGVDDDAVFDGYTQHGWVKFKKDHQDWKCAARYELTMIV